MGAGRYAVPCRNTARVERLTCHHHDRQEEAIRSRARHEVIVELWAWVCQLDPNTDTPLLGYLSSPNEAHRAVAGWLDRSAVAA